MKAVLQAGRSWVWLGNSAFPGVTRTQDRWLLLREREKAGKEDWGQELRKTPLMPKNSGEDHSSVVESLQKESVLSLGKNHRNDPAQRKPSGVTGEN